MNEGMPNSNPKMKYKVLRIEDEFPVITITGRLLESSNIWKVWNFEMINTKI